MSKSLILFLSQQLVKVGIASLLSIWVALTVTRSELARQEHHTTRED